MLSHLWGNIRPLSTQQRFLFIVGVILLVSGLVHATVAVGSLVAGQEWSGPVSWRKPVVFALSFGMLSITAAWILRLLPTTRWLWIPTVLLGAFSLLEVGVITLQKWRGVPSHFNADTPFDAAIFGIMAYSVGFVILATAMLLTWVVAGFRGNGGERLAAIVGLVSILAAGYIGGNMISVGDAHYEATGSVPYEVVFGADGSAKLAHFIGMHLIQFLAVLAILASARRRLAIVALGSLGGLAVFASVSLTAYAGQPWLAPDLGAGALGVVGLVASGTALVLSARSFVPRDAIAPTPDRVPVG